MQKSADAFRTISEVADDLTLPQHVLRFWETRFPQIRPLKRAGGRRYYRPADVLLLRTIRQLLYDDGYTIKGVQRLLKEQGPKSLGARTAQSDETAEADDTAANGSAEADGTALSNVLAADETAVIEAMSDPAILPASAPGVAARDAIGEPVGVDRRGLVEEALSSVEDCRRILDAVLRGRKS